jgi:predicted Zn-dependent peptidase
MIKNFQKKKLSNGITIIHEKRDLPLVSFGIANPFAGSHETADIKGIAHLIEHLVFTGTETRSHEDISREIEKKGGILNAFTANDVTAFWFKLPSEHLFKGIDILSDMLKNPTFEQEKFEKEKRVVLEEIKMYHDNPQRHVMEKLEENLYEKPFGLGITGTKESVSSLKREFVKSFFHEKYSPENFFVIIVGDADFNKVCEYFEKEFKPQNKTYKALDIKKRNSNSIEERSHMDQAHLALGFHAPMPSDKDFYVLDVLDAYLANGMSSKLFLEIREKRGLAYTVRSSLDYEKNYSYYSIYVGTTKKAIEEVKSLILKGFENASLEMTEKDLMEAKERLIGLKKVSTEEGINVLNGLIFSEISTGNAENYYKYEENINSVTLDEVKNMAKTLPIKYSSAAIVPK